MNSGGKDAKRPGREEKPKLLPGGLPASPEDMPSVTSDIGSRTTRSVGGVAAMSPFPLDAVVPPTSFGSGAPPPYGSLLMSDRPKSKDRGVSATSGVSSLSAGSYSSLSSPGPVCVPTSAAKTGSSFGWNFRDVPTLPEFHPLERTAVFVPYSSAIDVAERVTSVLRERSIASTFNDAKAKAKCVTADGVDFRVRLYRGKGKHAHGIIVEVQRRYGFSIKFHQDTKAILDGAEGKAPSTLEPQNYVPVVSDLEDEDETDEDESSSAGSKRKEPSSLSIASDMLKKSKTVDSNVIALESLASLTDPSRMGKSTALRVSSQILSESPEGSEVREAVISLIAEGRLKEQSRAADTIFQDEETTSQLKLLATTILSNAVSMVSELGSSAQKRPLQSQSALLSSEVVPALISEVRDADFAPQMSVAAARCLSALVSSKEIGAEAARAAREDGALQALAKARDVGRKGLASLEDAASVCIDAIELR